MKAPSRTPNLCPVVVALAVVKVAAMVAAVREAADLGREGKLAGWAAREEQVARAGVMAVGAVATVAAPEVVMGVAVRVAD